MLNKSDFIQFLFGLEPENAPTKLQVSGSGQELEENSRNACTDAKTHMEIEDDDEDNWEDITITEDKSDSVQAPTKSQVSMEEIVTSSSIRQPKNVIKKSKPKPEVRRLHEKISKEISMNQHKLVDFLVSMSKVVIVFIILMLDLFSIRQRMIR